MSLASKIFKGESSMLKKIVLSLVTTITMTAGIAQPSKADDPIKIIVGFAPGGGSDRIAREAQAVLQAAGKTAMVEYRPGAGGDIAAKEAANDQGNGVKLLLKGTSNIVLRNLQPNDVYRYADLQPVAYLGYVPLVLVTPKSSNIKTLDDFLRNTKSLTFGSSGVGSGTHLSGELLFIATQKSMIHVPYKGNSQIMPDIIAGRLDSSFVFPIQAKQFVDKGDLNAVAVAGARRVDSLPTVPTLDEKNLPNAYGKLMYVLFANPGAPAAQVQEIAKIFAQAFRDPKIAEQWRTNADIDVEPTRTLEMRKIMDSEFSTYRRLAERNPDLITRK